MKDNIQLGKIKLILLLCMVMAIQIRLVVSYLIYVGSDRLNGQLFRMAILTLLCVLTYQKRRPAKWVLIGWFVLNIVQAVYDPEFITNYYLIAIVVMYTIIPIYLLFSPDISAFLSKGRNSQ